MHVVHAGKNESSVYLPTLKNCSQNFSNCFLMVIIKLLVNYFENEFTIEEYCAETLSFQIDT